MQGVNKVNKLFDQFWQTEKTEGKNCTIQNYSERQSEIIEIRVKEKI